MAESDRELEERARAQAAAIAQAQAQAQRHGGGVGQVFGAIGRALRGGEAPKEAGAPAQQPGRELLLWMMKQAPDVQAALDLCFALLVEPHFATTVPRDRPCPVITFEARRKFNEAAKEWSEMGGGAAQTWLKCDRRLVLVHQPDALQLCVERRDLCVRFDQATAKLMPERVEGIEVMRAGSGPAILELFPNLTVPLLLAGMRDPGRLSPGQPRGAPDAYIAGGPLVANLEVFMQDRKKRPETKDDPGKGFATWLATLIKK